MIDRELEYFDLVKNKTNWSEADITYFWGKIRELHVKKSNFNFRGYHFPRFEQNHINIISTYGEPNLFEEDSNFWIKGQSLELFESCVFCDCTFTDVTSFSHVIFHKATLFDRSKFLKYSDFAMAQFKKGVSFAGAHFHDLVRFSNTLFDDKSQFKYCIYEYDADFSRIQFYKSPNFMNTEFRRNVDFTRTNFHERIRFGKGNFSEKFSTKLIEINKGLNEWENMPAPEFDFYNIIFPPTVELYNVDLTRTKFRLCDITKLRLSECKYIDQKHRIILFDEVREFDRFEETERRYSRASELYRQLKSNFDNEKNWELAGKAYRSEMLMRLKDYWREFLKKKGLTSATFDLLIYGIYGLLSGFTQSYARPLILLLASIFIIFPLCFYNLENNSFSESIQKSLNAALPYLKVDVNGLIYKVWWFKSLITLISTILLTFFIIALRKRFK
jgi:uncharacterized protein YjbI with pentapeptide repeats